MRKSFFAPSHWGGGQIWVVLDARPVLVIHVLNEMFVWVRLTAACRRCNCCWAIFDTLKEFGLAQICGALAIRSRILRVPGQLKVPPKLEFRLETFTTPSFRNPVWLTCVSTLRKDCNLHLYQPHCLVFMSLKSTRSNFCMLLSNFKAQTIMLCAVISWYWLMLMLTTAVEASILLFHLLTRTLSIPMSFRS